jgi:hypothetical protein
MIRYHQHSTNKARWYVSADNYERTKLRRDGWEPVLYDQVPDPLKKSKARGTWFEKLDWDEGRFMKLSPQYIHEGVTYRDLRRGGKMT